ncbi:MAG: hypothetical protein ACXAD7_11330 [Candidatus Kariarchaeaceae archaeon]
MVTITPTNLLFEENNLFSKFLELKNNQNRPDNSFKEQIAISLIIELHPSDEVLEEFIFSPKYKSLIRHEALTKAIELDNQQLLERVVLLSSNYEIMRTALNHIENQITIQKVAMGKNPHIPKSRWLDLQRFALQHITDPKLFSETILKVKSLHQLIQYFHKIRCKSNYRNMSSFLKRLVPVLIDNISDKMILNEFITRKYPNSIRKSAESKYHQNFSHSQYKT